MAKSNLGNTAFGVVVAVLIVASVAAIGYFQFNVAPSVFTSTTTTATTTTGLPSPGHYVNVSIVPGAAVSGKGYGPEVITVMVGVNNTVVWTNNDQAPHTVTATDNSFDSRNMNSGAVFQFTFNVPGTYKYGCTYHPWMGGTVVVKSA